MAGVAAVGTTLAQTAQTTVLNGVYSEEQAKRGAQTYADICAHCHEGGEPDAEPLFGAAFVDRWREAPLSFLHGFFSRQMPGDDPGSLEPQVYLDTLAFLLQQNGYPAGGELKADALRNILLVGANGPQPLPANALVSVVGCVTGKGDGMALERASKPERVRRADDISAEDLAATKGAQPGDNRYTLRGNGLVADAATGHKVQVKGVWVPGSGGITLSVLAFGDTGQICK